MNIGRGESSGGSENWQISIHANIQQHITEKSASARLLMFIVSGDFAFLQLLISYISVFL